MNEETFDALIGQMAADAALLQALTTTLIAVAPASRVAIEQLVEATALLGKQHLTQTQRIHHEQRLEELRPLWREEPTRD